MFDISPPVSAEVVVVSVADRPAWEPGVAATLVMVLGRNGNGAVTPFYVPFFGASEPIPPPGSRCRVTYRKGDGGIVADYARPFLKAPVVDEFKCEAGPEAGSATAANRSTPAK